MGAWSGRPAIRRALAFARPLQRSLIPGSLVLLLGTTLACTPRASDDGTNLPPAASPTVRGSGSVEPTIAATPDASGPALPVAVAPGDEVALLVGGSATVEGTEVTFTLLDARGPEAGCNDCPNHVRLRVACPAGPEELEFAFSGGMDPAALERARQQVSCGWTFYIVKVNEGSATVRVLSPA